MMRKLSKNSPKWINDALGVNVRKYISNGVDILKMQKVIFSFDVNDLASLKLFLIALVEIATQFKTKVEWELWLKDKPDYFKENIIAVTPLNLIVRVSKMLEYGKYSTR